MRKIGILISITLHLCLIYLLFTTAIPTANLQIKEKVITVVPIAPGKIVLYDTTQKGTNRHQISITRPDTPSRPTDIPDTPGGDRTAKTIATFSIGASASPSPILRARPDFLLETAKERWFPNPFGKIPTTEETNFSRYLSSYAHPYGNPSLGKDLPIGPNGNPTHEDESYKQATGRIDFDVPGFNIKPWVKQAITKIQLNWQVPPGLLGYRHASLTVGIRVTIERSGTLTTAEIGHSSLVEAIDRAALSALKTSAPFPGLPADFPEKNLVAYIRFNVNNND